MPVMVHKIEKKVVEIKLEGKIVGIPMVHHWDFGAETLLDVCCDPKDTEAAREKIEPLEEKFGHLLFKTVFVKDKDREDLSFRGLVHSDVIGQKFEYYLKVTDYETFEGKYDVEQYLKVSLNVPNVATRQYSSEYSAQLKPSTQVILTGAHSKD